MRERRIHLALALLTAVLGGLHLALAATLELAPDEAYYWTWSLDPGLAYADHPPLVAWLVAAGTALAGPTELGVRLWFVVLGTALIPLVFAAARAAGLRPAPALLAAGLAGISPLGSAAALIATPDTPLAVGWALGLWGLLRAGDPDGRSSAWLAVAAGTALALLSKLTGVLLPAIVLGWLALPAGARWRRQAIPYLAVAAGLVLALPAYLADLGGGGATAFQLGHGLWMGGLAPIDRLANLGLWLAGQVGLFGPLAAVALARFLAGRPRSSAGATLRLAAWLPWGVFGAAALLARPEPNWPAVAHLAGVVGAVGVWDEARGRGARWAGRRWTIAAVGLQLAVSLALHAHLARPFLPLGGGAPRPLEGPTDPAARLHGWRALAGALERQGAPVAAADYGVAAELRFYGSGREPAARPSAEGAWWVEPAAAAVLPGRPAERLPQGCLSTAPPVGAAAGLERPAAPVRLRWVRCPAR